jgi:hypothetical protein
MPSLKAFFSLALVASAAATPLIPRQGPHGGPSGGRPGPRGPGAPGGPGGIRPPPPPLPTRATSASPTTSTTSSTATTTPEQPGPMPEGFSLRENGARNTEVLPAQPKRCVSNTSRIGESGWKRMATQCPSGTMSLSTPTNPTSKLSTTLSKSRAGQTARSRSNVKNP